MWSISVKIRLIRVICVQILNTDDTDFCGLTQIMNWNFTVNENKVFELFIEKL
jgi:hypothetical protein